MARVGITKILMGMCFALFISSVAAESNLPDVKLNVDVKAARDLIDSWSGQGELLDQALEKLTRVLTADPENYLALKEMARYQIAIGYINGRYTKYKSHIYTVGNFTPGTLEQAEATIRSALRINPRFAEGYVYLGYIQFEQSKLEEAEKSLNLAEEIGTDDPWLDLNLAELYSAKGENLAAEKRWQHVLHSDTSNIKARSRVLSH